jgi:hypothetical protein
LCGGGSAASGRSLHLDQAVHAARSAEDLFAWMVLDRQRLAGQQGFVNRGPAVEHFAVHRDRRVRRHAQAVAGPSLIDLHCFNSVVDDAHRLARDAFGQGAQSARCLAARTSLEVLADADEHYDQGGGIEDDQIGAVGDHAADAAGEGRPGTECDQDIHVGHAAQGDAHGAGEHLASPGDEHAQGQHGLHSPAGARFRPEMQQGRQPAGLRRAEVQQVQYEQRDGEDDRGQQFAARSAQPCSAHVLGWGARSAQRLGLVTGRVHGADQVGDAALRAVRIELNGGALRGQVHAGEQHTRLLAQTLLDVCHAGSAVHAAHSQFDPRELAF